jgi:hypothetical protein
LQEERYGSDRLVSLLAAGVTPVDSHVSTRPFGYALFIGVLGATLLVVACYGLRPDLGEMLVTPRFWAKLAFPAALLARSQ